MKTFDAACAVRFIAPAPLAAAKVSRAGRTASGRRVGPGQESFTL